MLVFGDLVEQTVFTYLSGSLPASVGRSLSGLKHKATTWTVLRAVAAVGPPLPEAQTLCGLPYIILPTLVAQIGVLSY